MTTFYPHTRQLGAESGVQLNPVRDNTGGFGPDGSDQVVSTVGRFKRGRRDIPFLVNRGNLRAKLGPPESTVVSELNEAYVHIYEAVNNGAAEAVVARLTSAAAAEKYAVFRLDTSGEGDSFSAVDEPPTGSNYVLYLRDLECFSDGIRIEINAIEAVGADGTTPAPTKMVTIRVREPDGTLRAEATGSLDTAAVDDYGQDAFVGTLLASQLDTLELTAAAGAEIPPTAECYGTNPDGTEKLVTSGEAPIVLFVEGGSAYMNTDYDRVVAALEKSPFDYGYCVSAGSRAVALISKLATMNVRANRQFIVDIPGNLPPLAAKTFRDQLSIDSHYVQFYWAPLRADDPVNGGKAMLGFSGYQAGLRCARNAQVNAYGLAPKHFPIAGVDWPIARTRVVPLYSPDSLEMSMLAKSQINPVLFERYNSGGKYVFLDSLSGARVANSYKKLITVAEMSSSIDDRVVKFAKEALQKPMEIAIDMVERFLQYDVFEPARSSGWLVASNEPALGNKGWAFTVERSKVKPAEDMIIKYGSHYDGVARAIYVTQTISR
ncbi:hypothetical protein [Burkholderia ambifaria]|uniref:hypothetical protein n=1 Tax=Burkholderia ambifaria TaxID=152480 RepID=UPI00158D5521|nr:hypothetical protein [Burkholderia ambifaria]